MFRENHKFLAFALIIAAIVVLVLVASGFDPKAGEAGDIVVQGKLRIIDAAVSGLVAVAGMAAQALFRHSQTEADLASAVKSQADSIPAAPPPPIEDIQPVPVVVQNSPTSPAIVQEVPRPDAEGDADAAPTSRT